MKKVGLGLAAIGVAYQGYGIYGLYYPSPQFKGWEVLENVSAPVASPTDLKTNVASIAVAPVQLTTPDGLFHIRPVVPREEIKDYLEKSKGDLLYLDFKDITFEKGNMYHFLLDQMVEKPDVTEITDDKGEENIERLQRELSSRMLLRMTSHIYHYHFNSSFSPQAWVSHFYRLFRRNTNLQEFGKTRHPVILIEHAEKWQELVDQRQVATESEIPTLERKVAELFHFLEWLYFFRMHSHVIIVAAEPINQVLVLFKQWHDLIAKEATALKQ